MESQGACLERITSMYDEKCMGQQRNTKYPYMTWHLWLLNFVAKYREQKNPSAALTGDPGDHDVRHEPRSRAFPRHGAGLRQNNPQKFSTDPSLFLQDPSSNQQVILDNVMWTDSGNVKQTPLTGQHMLSYVIMWLMKVV